MKKKSCSASTQIRPFSQNKNAYWLVLLRIFLCWAAFGFLLPWVFGSAHWIFIKVRLLFV